MSRTAYILTYDRDDLHDYLAFHKKFVSMPEVISWFHYIKTSYIVISNVESATELSNKIRKLLPGKRFLLMELNLENRNGILPPKAWDWIKKQASLSN